MKQRVTFRRILPAFLVVSSLIGAACTTSSSQRQQSVRVMSYNIAAGNGDLARVADVIRAANADIIGLQEVDVHWSERSGFADQAADLAAMLGMQVRFGPIYSLPADGAGRREFGLAVLTQHPIIEFHNHVIPRLSTQTDEPEPQPMPGFIEAVIDVRGTRIHVFNTHLDYRPDPRVRVAQVAAMLRVMPQPSLLHILIGDLNAPPSATELQPLFARFRDAWFDDRGPGHTYPALAPERRIDYVLVSERFRITGARTITTLASDHLPVIADVRVN
jgi:endonuclease/exonuclease/phosphatase family metal-dependent hydrolase